MSAAPPTYDPHHASSVTRTSLAAATGPANMDTFSRVSMSTASTAFVSSLSALVSTSRTFHPTAARANTWTVRQTRAIATLIFPPSSLCWEETLR